MKKNKVIDSTNKEAVNANKSLKMPKAHNKEGSKSGSVPVRKYKMTANEIEALRRKMLGGEEMIKDSYQIARLQVSKRITSYTEFKQCMELVLEVPRSNFGGIIKVDDGDFAMIIENSSADIVSKKLEGTGVKFRYFRPSGNLKSNILAIRICDNAIATKGKNFPIKKAAKIIKAEYESHIVNCMSQHTPEKAAGSSTPVFYDPYEETPAK